MSNFDFHPHLAGVTSHPFGILSVHEVPIMVQLHQDLSISKRLISSASHALNTIVL